MVSAAAATSKQPVAINLQQDQQHQLQLIQQHNQTQLLQQQQQNAINEFLMNGGGGNSHSSSQIGRQGPIKDVKSIIDDYRQKHPETVPRRGRRLKGTTFEIENDGRVSSSRRSMMIGDDDQTISHHKSLENELRLLLFSKIEGNSRPSSRDSSQSNSNFMGATNTNTSGNATGGNVSLNDVLLEFAKFTQSERLNAAANAAAASASSPARTTDNNHTSTPILKAPPGYPEVTLHPVSALLDSSGGGNSQMASGGTGTHSNSLLHGILTKVILIPHLFFFI